MRVTSESQSKPRGVSRKAGHSLSETREAERVGKFSRLSRQLFHAEA